MEREIEISMEFDRGGIFTYTREGAQNHQKMWKITIFCNYSEEFTEFGIATSGTVENLFLEVQEEMELKISVHHYIHNRGRGQQCSDIVEKSTSICRENCIWEQVENDVHCSGPWVKNRKTEYCNNYEDVKKMTVVYKK